MMRGLIFLLPCCQNRDRLNFHSDGLSHTYGYNNYGTVHFVFQGVVGQINANPD